MAISIDDKGKKIYKCNVCGFGYLSHELADKCENYCTKHGACSLEITKHAILKGQLD